MVLRRWGVSHDWSCGGVGGLMNGPKGMGGSYERSGGWPGSYEWSQGGARGSCEDA